MVSCNTTIVKTNSQDDLLHGTAIIDSFHSAINTKNKDFRVFLHDKFYNEVDSKESLDSSIIKLYSSSGVFLKDSIILYNIITYSNRPESDEYFIRMQSIYTNDTLDEGFYLLNQEGKLKVARLDINFK
jgi:hypothetical protein